LFLFTFSLLFFFYFLFLFLFRNMGDCLLWTVKYFKKILIIYFLKYTQLHTMQIKLWQQLCNV
jgi:hypothetical protein